MTSPAVVTNASPLIYLALVNQFSLLNQLFIEVYLPGAVYQEVIIQGGTQPGAKETLAAVQEGWMRHVVVQERIAVDNLLDELHVGEAETIVLAREMGINRVLLDDHSARNKARLVGLEMTGTIGILLLAQKMGILQSFQRELGYSYEQQFSPFAGDV